MQLARTVRRARTLALPLLMCAAAGGCGDGTEGGYYPLESGRWWYYAIDETVLDERRADRYVALNGGRVGNSAEPVYAQMMQTRSVDYLRAHGDGVERVSHLRPGMPGPKVDEKPRVILPAKIAAGASWEVASTLSLIESRTFEPRDRVIPRRLPVALTKRIDAVDAVVHAGERRFSHCLTVSGTGQATIPTDRDNSSAAVSVTTREWFAPGVGLVKLERDETSDSTFLKNGRQRWELIDYGN